MSTQNLLTDACTGSAPTPPEAEEGGRTPLADAANAAEELYRLRDTFFPRDPAEKAAALRARADAALALLDAVPSGMRRPQSSQLPLSNVFLHLISVSSTLGCSEAGVDCQQLIRLLTLTTRS